ncbi:MAG TPA: FAD-binding dehydrogenase [Spirochaetes bacterium]|nr:FAD-binding dehydrogenase [Spirochaetota bacterium]
MGSPKHYHADVVVAGGGIAGIVTALELLDYGKKVVLLDRDEERYFGGQAITAFGGMMIVGSPVQKRMGIKDTPELAFKDWCNTAGFSFEDVLPRQWAEMYCHRNLPDVYRWLRGRGVRFLPAVMWPERGFYGTGNSLPRYHIAWGTGYGFTSRLIENLMNHKNRRNLEIHFNHRVTGIETSGGAVCGLSGEVEGTGEPFEVKADVVVIAAGGLGGNLKKVRALWPKEMGKAPDDLFIGSHPFCDGAMQDMAEKLGGVLTNMGYMWNYPDGVTSANPRFPGYGLHVITPKSALWMDYRGRRFGPQPLIGYIDTTYVVARICGQEKPFSWHVMNWKIAARELALSGSDHNDAIRDKKFFTLLKNTLFGNHELVKRMVRECPDFITADTVQELAKKMNDLAGTDDIDAAGMEQDIRDYDAQIDRGVKFFNDDQLRRIAHSLRWSGDRVRTCKYQKILDPKAGPLLAIRYRMMTRKCLGGIRTDLHSRVVDRNDRPVEGLYAVGEAAGFGGGGINGKSSLEGTFIAPAILGGRIAARSISGERNP